MAVRGNMDQFPLDEMLPERDIVEAGGLRIGVTHGGGSPFDIEARVLAAFAGEPLDLIVFGHTHKAGIRRAGGLLLVNPGAAQVTPFGEAGSYLRIDPRREPVAEIVPLVPARAARA